jgi:phenol 2-monooxygenase (NADPH)
MMAATWASRLGIKTRIVDKRGSKIFNGQADGLQCRSLEIFDSFGFADRAWKESNHMIEMCFWVRFKTILPGVKGGRRVY